MRKLFSGITFISILISSCTVKDQKELSRIDLIKKRGELICGVSGKIPGFSFLSSKGEYRGLDIDICKSFASAILGDSQKIEYRPLTATERFTAIKTGEIDLLSRNTTFTLSRDSLGGNGLNFGPVIFYDGQGIMVKKESGIRKIEDLSNKSICLGSGTTTEQNINDVFEKVSLPYKPIKYQDLNQVIAGYLQGRCSAITSDRSQLAAARSSFLDPSNHIILDSILSKEPLAPASEGSDQSLADVMRWTIYALFTAEEEGITKSNVEEKYREAENNTKLKSLRRLFGIDGALGEKIGLNNNFVFNVIKDNGNYGEIYERNLGEGSNVSIPRGLNKSYKEGGLHFSPPFN